MIVRTRKRVIKIFNILLLCTAVNTACTRSLSILNWKSYLIENTLLPLLLNYSYFENYTLQNTFHLSTAYKTKFR